MPEPSEIIHSLVQNCIKRQDIASCREAHSLLIGHRLGESCISSDHFIRLFASLGSLLEANLAFCSISTPCQFSWQAIIWAHLSLGQPHSALALFASMQEKGVSLNKCIALSVLKACVYGNLIYHGWQLHHQIVAGGLISDVMVVNSLIDMHAKVRNFDEARKLFDGLPDKDLISFGVMIAGYTYHGHGFLALELFESLHQHGLQPDKVTFVSVLKACTNILAFQEGRLVHDKVVRKSFHLDVVVGSTLIDMYAKCGSLPEARKVFDILTDRNIVSWGAMLTGYIQHGHANTALFLYEKLQVNGLIPDKVTCICALKACGDLEDIESGRLLHCEIVERGYHTDSTVESALIDMYGKCKQLSDCHDVFNKSQDQGVMLWNTLIYVCSQQGECNDVLELFEMMLLEGKKPSDATFSCVMKTCGDLQDIWQGRLSHDQIIKSGFAKDVIIGSTLIDMYCNCGSLAEACKVFDSLATQDVIVWGSMIAGYAQHDHGLQALQLFVQMQEKHIETNKIIVSSLIKACESIGALPEGKILHLNTIESGIESDVVITNTLIVLYVGCGCLEEAQSVFKSSSNHDMVSWNAMITGYVQHGYFLSGLELYGKMQRDGLQPNTITFLSILKACGLIGALEKGRLVHHQIFQVVAELDGLVGSSLVFMYASCGSLQDAQKVFDHLVVHYPVAWNALISGHAQGGNWRLVHSCVQEMQSQGLKPDERINTLMLASCSQIGQLEKGNAYFDSLKNEHDWVHTNCMVDLYGRVGKLHEAVELLASMPDSPNITGLMSLLTACKKFSNPDVGRQCFGQIVDIVPNSGVAYEFMSNIYVDAHMWHDACMLHDFRTTVNSWKKPGRASIEVNNYLHEIIVADECYMTDNDIIIKLKRLLRRIEDDGYLPDLDTSFMHIVDAEQGFLCMKAVGSCS